MYNIVKVISDDHVVGEARDEGLIAGYGKLQEVISIDGKDKAQANQIAANTLKELGRVAEENGLTLLGDDRFRAGRYFDITEPLSGLKGRYLITEARHTVGNGLHTMDLSLEVK